MTNLLVHPFIETHADGPDPTLVNPSNWNDGHKFTGGNSGAMLVRDTTDATYGASWVNSVAAGQVWTSQGIGALPAWSASPTLTTSLTVPTVQTATGANLNLVATGNAQIRFNTLATDWWAISAAGHLLALTDNNNDIGAAGATRPRIHYLGTALVVGTNPATSGELRVPNNGGINGRSQDNSSDVALLKIGTDNSAFLAAGGADIRWGRALVAVGATTLITLGKTGGSGPAAAAQDSWMRVLDSNGVAFFVPAWK